jgi:7-cyano-7-deazaguanine synthase
MSKRKLVIVYSGGLDSTVLLATKRLEGNDVRALSVNYGQRHSRELDCAARVCATLGVPHVVVDLSSMRQLLTGSSQTDDSVPVPHGHYAEENMKLTVVPNRNMVLLAVAGAWAIAQKCDAIAYAAHAGDHAIYPDCREEFVGPFAAALAAADWHKVEVERPFLKLSKTNIVEIGGASGLGLEMAMSYSCYEGKELHCGLCGTCQERRVAFRDAGVIDQTPYDQHGLAVLPTSQLSS